MALKKLYGGYKMEQVIVRVSSKRQITLPAAIYKKGARHFLEQNCPCQAIIT
jgi:hypothetical protein